MKPSAYYKILEDYINSLKGIPIEEKNLLLQNLDTLFIIQTLKFLELNIPENLLGQFYKDFNNIPEDSTFKLKMLENFILNYFEKIPDGELLFTYFMEQQSIKTLSEIIEYEG